jgi:hypothetical protein
MPSKRTNTKKNMREIKYLQNYSPIDQYPQTIFGIVGVYDMKSEKKKKDRFSDILSSTTTTNK